MSSGSQCLWSASLTYDSEGFHGMLLLSAAATRAEEHCSRDSPPSQRDAEEAKALAMNTVILHPQNYTRMRKHAREYR